MTAAVLVAALLWPLAAFGGGELTTALPFCVACLAAAACIRPPVARGASRFVDIALAALIALVLFQLLPVPTALSRLLSPAAMDVKGAITLEPAGAGSASLSINAAHTAWAALVTAASVVIFWMARGLFDRGGVRRVVRSICAAGLAVSVLAIAQAATAGRRIYWIFPTYYEGPLPFGPFVNRNHFATWVIMAAPLCFGYIAARSDASGRVGPRSGSPRQRFAALIGGRTIWLAACGAAMIAALLLSLSRSGIVALAASGVVTILITRGRADSSRYWWFLVAGASALLAGALWSDVGAVAERFAAASTAVEGRVRIWRETVPIVRDFWLTGTGAGTYQTAMLLYQQSDRLWYFNQAHNHYLQLAAEGGLLLSVPAALALAAYARQAARRAREDRSGMFWIRCGALCGLGAAALQSVWETGLTMPANSALAAVLAALAVHERSGEGRG